MASRAVALRVSYDGAGFAGFARQPGLRTVQGELEQALATCLRCPVQTVGAGRTDAGVHALGQVVSFQETGGEPRLELLVRSLNALTGEDLVVQSAAYAEPGFDARRSALAREYRYHLVPGPVPPLFNRKTAWWVRRALDLEAMRLAAEPLIGEHDFAAFCVKESASKGPTRRRVDLVEVLPSREMGEHVVVVRVVGNAFLHSMVRIIVGSLVEVGAGRRDPGWIEQALLSCDRAQAGPTAPPHGLTLWHVAYPDECWL
ncbi:MAG: tRNA pseudouridine(38-40) synthase TruA [Anaerosomatales bacterium]|nr:tRNA pseudouridine(38-40) synthase TruA [Anaerosomatales bacterium]